MNEMPINVDEQGAVGSFVNDMVLEHLVVESLGELDSSWHDCDCSFL